MFVTLSNHGEERFQERCKLKKKSAVRVAEKAYNNGLQIDETTGSLNKWAKGKYNQRTGDCTVRIYGEKMYLFKEDKTEDNMDTAVLITVLDIPKRFMKATVKAKARKESSL